MELVESGAPVLVKLQSSLDPDRAISLLREDACYHHQALRCCVSAVAIVVERSPKKTTARGSRGLDRLIDYLLVRRDGPCGRSVPELLMKAIAWLEKFAEFQDEQKATRGRAAWAITDKLVEILSKGSFDEEGSQVPGCHRARYMSSFSCS